MRERREGREVRDEGWEMRVARKEMRDRRGRQKIIQNREVSRKAGMA